MFASCLRDWCSFFYIHNLKTKIIHNTQKNIILSSGITSRLGYIKSSDITKFTNENFLWIENTRKNNIACTFN